MEPSERALLHETVRATITAAMPAGSDAVDSALGQLGWIEMLDAEPRDSLEIVFGELGVTNGSASLLDDVVVSALGVRARPELAILLPRYGSWEPPGFASGGRLSARGVATPRAGRAGEMLVVHSSRSGVGAATVPMTAVEVRPVEGIDPDAGLHVAQLELDLADVARVDDGAWGWAIARGRCALAQQMVGACRTMLDLARVHALERVQFDRPIARFQAVRHRLAEALVAIEAVEATLTAAGDEPGPMTAALAKAAAGRGARTVAAHCQQVLAGIGFTTDHPFHRFLKRTLALEGLLGTADEIVLDVGRDLLAARRVPPLIEL
jgi:hypothetical protein